MKKIIVYITLFILPLFILNSCRMGLDELPVFEDAQLTNFWFEHREIVTKSYPNGQEYEVVVFTDIKSACTFETLGDANNVTECKVTINSSKTNKTIDLSNIVGKATISTAATIEPVNSSPVLGVPGNFSSPVTYVVKAADGKTVKTYKITVVLQ